MKGATFDSVELRYGNSGDSTVDGKLHDLAPSSNPVVDGAPTARR
jgi:hypothetical protein